MGDTKRTNFHQRDCRSLVQFVSSPFSFFSRSAESFCLAHQGILAGKRKEPEVLANAIFLRFPNEKQVNAILAENIFSTYRTLALAKTGWTKHDMKIKKGLEPHQCGTMVRISNLHFNIYPNLPGNVRKDLATYPAPRRGAQHAPAAEWQSRPKSDRIKPIQAEIKADGG
jgi:hypothetical protein